MFDYGLLGPEGDCNFDVPESKTTEYNDSKNLVTMDSREKSVPVSPVVAMKKEKTLAIS